METKFAEIKRRVKKMKKIGPKAWEHILSDPPPLSHRPGDYSLKKNGDKKSSLRRSSEKGGNSVARGSERTKKSEFSAVWDTWSNRQRARRTVKEVKPTGDVKNDYQSQIFATGNVVKDNTREFNTFTRRSEAIFTATPTVYKEKETTLAKYQSNFVKDSHLVPDANRHRNVEDKLHNTDVTVIRATEQRTLTAQINSPVMRNLYERQNTGKSQTTGDKQVETSNRKEIAAVRIRNSETSTPANKDSLRHPTNALRNVKLQSRASSVPPILEGNRPKAHTPVMTVKRDVEKPTLTSPMDSPAQGYSSVRQKTVKSRIIGNRQAETSNTKEIAAMSIRDSATLTPINKDLLRYPTIAPRTAKMHSRSTILTLPVHEGNKPAAPTLGKPIQKVTTQYTTYTSPVQRKTVIIVAEPRTGSSFLGDAFNQNPDVFYLFEPLHGVVLDPSQHERDPKPMQFLAGILGCKFLSPRDPRPVVFSHMKVGINTWTYFRGRAKDGSPHPSLKMYSAQICRQIEANVRTFLELTNKTNNRYHILPYEDLARNPVEILQRMYKISGITMHNDTLNWIKNHTSEQNVPSNNVKGYNFSTKRNSKANVDNWRFEVDPCLVNIIEDSCRPLMQLLGYKLLNRSEKTQYDLTVSLYDHIYMNTQ
ncbi:Carbohydrate sulfotransferase 1 [Stylophora pistillata]|uniref:Carbohydrate sulfotransferase 1 n=1 Tax=Stylophora pistillata TaxID=50429 RepID=A0A2B4S6N8_STYPI|nr:Carbohydrate sulfotransferase 1 [Stylophora pistillata]